MSGTFLCCSPTINIGQSSEPDSMEQPLTENSQLSPESREQLNVSRDENALSQLLSTREYVSAVTLRE